MDINCEHCGKEGAKTSLFGRWSEETGEFIFSNLCEKCNTDLTAERNKEDLEVYKELEPLIRETLKHMEENPSDSKPRNENPGRVQTTQHHL